jgi:hypothetical protein
MSNYFASWPGMAALGMAALALTVSASPAPARSIFEACEGDIQAYCDMVTPGNGRLMACLYAHEDKVSDSCDVAIDETADIIDIVFERLRYVSQQCGEDIRTYCADVAVGEARVLSCLHGKKASLSSSCAEVIDRIQLPSD